MSDAELLKAFEQYVKTVGHEKALAELVVRGVGPSTAERLVTKNYAYKKPQRRIKNAIRGALNLDKAS